MSLADCEAIKKLLEDIKYALENADKFDRPPRPATLISSALKHKLDSGRAYQGPRPVLERIYLEARQEAVNLGLDIPIYQEKTIVGLQELQQFLAKAAKIETEHITEADPKKEAGTKAAETEQKVERRTLMTTTKSNQENWDAIKNEYDISKNDFGKKINFVKDLFKRKVIFRDVEDAFVLAWGGFPKAAIILAGGVIEELLRLYLEHKNVQAERDDFFNYIKACQEKKPPLLKSGISKLSDSVREWRNLVHLSIEEPKRHTISKATAKGAVSSIFIIANDFQ
jgi:hypothetical protein